MNDLIFRRTGKIRVVGETKASISETIEYMKNLSKLGYYIDFNELNILTKETMLSSLDILEEFTKNTKMKDKPFYINFPEQVENMTVEELYVNSILHYWIGFTRREIDIKDKRPELTGEFSLKKIELVNNTVQNVIGETLNNIIHQKVAYSNQDKEDVEKLLSGNIKYNLNIRDLLIKENKFYILNLINVDNIKEWFDTPTDILRYLAYNYADKDTSLSTSIRFKAMSRKNRRLVMELLNKMKGKEEDILRYKAYWKNLAHFVHPYEYVKYKNAINLFKIAVDDIKVETFNNKMELLITSNKWKDLNNHLKSRPTEFVRKFDLLVRNCSVLSEVFSNMADILPEVSTSAIISLVNKYMNGEFDEIMYTPKAIDMKFFVKDNKKSDHSQSFKDFIIEMLNVELSRRFGEKENLGKVYLDEKLKQYNIPMQIRNLSKSQNAVARWSRFKMPEDKNYIRTFIHWKNIENKAVDIDSAFSILDVDGRVLDSCSYSDIKSKFGTMIHSGDVITAPPISLKEIIFNKFKSLGADEFLDIIKDNYFNNLKDLYAYINRGDDY